MRTRSQTRNRNRQQQAQPAVVQPFHLEEPVVNPPLVPMADNRTMAQLLQAPTEGYEDAIVIPEINANFELKHGLINLVQNKQFFGHDKEDPHAHIRYFNKITSTMRFPDIPSTSIKLMLFPFSLEDTFYNALNANDQDSLNSAAGGNFLDKMPRECLRIIESKSKVRNSRNKAVVAKVSSNSSTPGISPDVAALTTEVSELKNMMKTMLIDKQKAQAPAPVKAVEQSCVTCGGAHSYRNCPATDGNVYRDNIQEYVSQAAAANFNQGNTNSRPPMVSNQIRPPGFPPIQNNQNRFNQNQGNNFNQNRGTNFNQNRGNNFYQGQVYQPPTSQPPVYQAQPYQARCSSKCQGHKGHEAVLLIPEAPRRQPLVGTLCVHHEQSLESHAPGEVKPEIGGNVNFEIKIQFMRELREDTFFRNKNEDAHDHVDRVLNNVSLFNIPEVSQDAVLLRVFPFTLTGSAKRWGPIPGMTPTQALAAIQTMADYLQKWHDRTSSRNVSSTSNTDGLAAIIWRLSVEWLNLGTKLRRMKALLKSWVIDCFEEALNPDKDPMERSFDDYKWVFDLEIEQLADEYELGFGKKGYILDMIWENRKNIQGKAKEWWYDYWLEEEEKQENRDKKYDPPMVHMKTFEITRYSFDQGDAGRASPFDRLKVWELVDKPFGKTVIKLKWLWKNKTDEDNKA
ncbi:hypothetical protein Tco_0700084 [Tanacetum coccineum]